MNEPLIEHAYADLDEVKLHYLRAGESRAGRPAVLLVHGWPQTGAMWRKVIPELARHYLVLAPDLRGLGDSTRPQTGYDKRTLANDLWRLLRSLKIRRCHAVGHDWGAPTVFALAVAHRQAVRSVVALDAPVPGDGSEAMASGRWHHFFHHAPDLPEALVAGREAVYLGHFFRHWGARTDVFSAEEIAEYVRAYSRPGALRAGFNLYRAMAQDARDNRRALAKGKLKMPVLALGGPEGRGRGKLALESWQRVAENVQGGVLEGAGHWIAEEKPRELLDRLLPFLASAP
ncbi:MAG: alpha/beta hydrolase [Alphaproteobacteria bacterium]|nr:alpha/beta hydrolase [Alphaproteobacteria bacterium]